MEIRHGIYGGVVFTWAWRWVGEGYDMTYGSMIIKDECVLFARVIQTQIRA